MHMFFNILCERTYIYKAFHCIPKHNKEKASVWWFELWTEAVSFCMHDHFCLKEQLIENSSCSDLDILQTFCPKWTKWTCHFKENNSDYLLPLIKFELSSKKLEFWKTCVHHCETDSFLTVTDSSAKRSAHANTCDPADTM